MDHDHEHERLLMKTLWKTDEGGASAILVASSLLLLIGMAAIAVDLGAGFNTRRQNQTSADLASTAAAIEAANETIAVTEALEVARLNLDATFSDADWQTLWQSCTDPDRPTGFKPVTNVFGSGNLDCISINPAGQAGLEFRVRIPDQLTGTSFARTMGVSNLTTNAVAHSQVVFTFKGDIVPFGLLYGAATGAEQCILQPAGGLASGPCTGGASGNFGTMQLPAWGNPTKGTSINCNRSDTGLIAQNIAIGQDHIVLPATGADGQVDSFPGSGGPHPSNGGVVPFPDNLAKRDACTSASGESEPTDLVPVSPLNTIDTETGTSSDPFKVGLFGNPGPSDPVFPGGLPPRMRQVVNSETLNLLESSGGNNAIYVIDNTALWQYLPNSSSGVPGTEVGGTCNRGTYNGGWAFNRARLIACLGGYEAYLLTNPSPPAPLFVDGLADNPRFGWAPRFHYTTWGSGTTWQPIHSFEALYIDGIWFNCNGSGNGPNNEPCDNSKGVHFYPKEYPNGTPLKSGNSANGAALRLDQMSGILIPIEALPDSVLDTYPGTRRGPFKVQLVR